MNRFDLIDKLNKTHELTDEELLHLLFPICENVIRHPLSDRAVDDCSLNEDSFSDWTEEEERYLYEKARDAAQSYYGKSVYLRGLVEFTNYCKNDCYYCGIRCSNKNTERYRLSKEDILSCCDQGYMLGFRTFVLQGGEDPYYSDDMICELVSAIKRAHPDCAVTLSIGEKERESYQAYFDAGADRYLLREETSDAWHYRYLHPEALSMEHRQNCLRALKDIGYQVGCGIMVGSPMQKPEYIIEDLRFMQELEPEMIGIGPFIPHKNTKFADEAAGTLKDTLHLLSVLRLMFPSVLLPATTALGTIHPLGREMGIKAGANVVMPNLSPIGVRGKYLLYDGKICTGDEAAECRMCMQRRIESTGYHVEISRGDHAELPVSL